MRTTWNQRQRRLTRREWIRNLSAAGLAFGLAPRRLRGAANPPHSPRFPLGACDWSLGQMAKTEAFDVAQEIGLDGVQVSLGTAANDMHLRRPEIQAAYRAAVERTGLKVASLAIGEMNNVPYKSDPRTIEWVADSIDACQALGCSCVLLAFFYHGDLKGDAQGTQEVVRRLREVAPKAEKAGVSLGLESWLSAEEHVDIIDRVGSPAVKVYYDVANASKMGYDIYREIRWLGQQGLICEFHAKENGALLGQGVVDFPRVRAAMEAINYQGWIQIEGAVPSGGSMKESYVANQRFLRSVFI